MRLIKSINRGVVLIFTIVSLILAIYSLIPKVQASFEALGEKQVEALLRHHTSFVRDGNIDGMLSLYHPEFSMEVVHSTGRKESFNKSQISKHQEYFNALFSVSIEEKVRLISLLNRRQALVSIAMTQEASMKGASIGTQEKLFQTFLIESVDGAPKILKVLSMAENW